METRSCAPKLQGVIYTDTNIPDPILNMSAIPTQNPHRSKFIPWTPKASPVSRKRVHAMRMGTR